MSNPVRKPSDRRSRHAILEILKWQGPQDAQRLAKQLKVSAMAVRQHLYALTEEKLVASEEEPRPMGRPAKLWRLTQAANDIFPNAHTELTVGLINSMTKAFGEKGLDKLLAIRTREQIKTYRPQMPQRASLRKRLERLAEIRTREGYMAEVQEAEDGTLLLVENHCPICVAATACTGLCAGELRLFQEILGKDINIERTDHIVAGARRCAYTVRAKRLSRPGS